MLDLILKHMEDNNLESADGINILQLIIDNDVEVSTEVQGLVDSYKDIKKERNE